MALRNIEKPNNQELFLYYSPTVPADWSPVPDNVYDALDELGNRTSGAGTVSAITAGSGITCTPNPITTSGTVAITNTGVLAGSYTFPMITVNSTGQLTSASSGSAVTSVGTGTGLTGGPITSTGTIAIANTGVTSGTYTNSTVTVNNQGQITSASSGTAPVTSVTGGTGINVTGSTSAVVNISNTGVGAGSYVFPNLTVNAQGQITSASSGSAVTSVGTGTGLTGGPITSTGTVSIDVTGVTAGSYTNTNLTVNAQGQITSASSGTAPVTSISAGTGINITGGPTTPTISIANTGVTAGSYGPFNGTINAQGQVTAATNILTTKGDILIYDTAPDRLPVGSNGQGLIVNSGSSSGVSWTTNNNFVTNASFKTSVASNALTVTLTQGDGVASAPTLASPCIFNFRSSTLSSGTTVQVAATSGITITIPSGTTIGTTNGDTRYIYVYAVNNAGTVILGVSLTPFALDGLVSTTAISGGSSATTLYTTAAQTSLAIQYLGKFVASQSTAGTWTANSTEIYPAIGYDYAADLGPVFTDSTLTGMGIPGNLLGLVSGTFTPGPGTYNGYGFVIDTYGRITNAVGLKSQFGAAWKNSQSVGNSSITQISANNLQTLTPSFTTPSVSILTLSTGTYTTGPAGMYTISCWATFSASSGGTSRDVLLYHNGNEVGRGSDTIFSGSFSSQQSCCVNVLCNGSDTLTANVYQDSGGSLTVVAIVNIFYLGA